MQIISLIVKTLRNAVTVNETFMWNLFCEKRILCDFDCNKNENMLKCLKEVNFWLTFVILALGVLKMYSCLWKLHQSN